LFFLQINLKTKYIYRPSSPSKTTYENHKTYNSLEYIQVKNTQGEGGVRELKPDFVKFLRKFCDEHGILLVIDEIQTGVGRTGNFWACERSGVLPDLLTFAKGIASGFI